MWSHTRRPGSLTQQQHHSRAILAAKPLPRPLAQPVYCKATTKPVVTQKGRQTAKGSQQSTKNGKQSLRGGQVIGTKTFSSKGKTQRGLETVDPSRGVKSVKGGQQQQQQQERKGSRFYLNITGFPFPLGPFFQRKTVRNEVVRNQVWTFEQTQGFFFDVFTPVRMTVIKLKSGGLWVHAPVAPTQECINLLKELDAPVEYIVLPTFAYEHKVFVGPFSRRFPNAKVYVSPFQWSFPLNLPPQFFGIFPAGTLIDGDTTVPWADEIEQKVLLPPPIGVSKVVRFTEVSFFHKASKSLLVTDAVLYVDKDPPACIPEEVEGLEVDHYHYLQLLKSARNWIGVFDHIQYANPITGTFQQLQALKSQMQDGWLQKYLAGGRSRSEIQAVARKGKVEDTLENRRLAWARMSLLVLYFNPSDLLTPQESFEAVSEKLIVGPVVRTLVYDKIPNTVCDWVDSMCRDWNFQRIIPCHFAAPIKAGPSEFKEAFRFVYEQAGRVPVQPSSSSSSNPFSSLFSGLFGGQAAAAAVSSNDKGFPAADIKVLTELNKFLVKNGIVFTDAEERGGVTGYNSSSDGKQ